MDDSLEALLEKATNPKNKYEDWEFIMAFCDKVNMEVEGPQIALRIIVPKMRDSNEKVALLSLTLLEACVKNGGKRFHQELGKFRFLNELIKMISPKYLGNQTAPAVQKKVKELLYSWKPGLPQEPKIADAYEMLKKEGLMFDESVPRDPTFDEATTKARVSLIQDPRQSQMLQKLLASKNPEDLRAANRLIREMVRRDDKRMQKMQKRLDELELIQNNVKLLSELLSHYRPDSGDSEKGLIKELHDSLEKMRPNLFRMASEMKQNEEGMTDILQTNERLLRVMDRYKKLIGETDPEAGTTGTENGTSSTKSVALGDGTSASAGSGVSMATKSEAPPSDSTAGAVGGASDVLIDLADLNLGSPPPASSSTGGQGSTNMDLLGDLGLLNLPPLSGNQNAAFNMNWQAASSASGVPFSMGPPVQQSSAMFAPLGSTNLPLSTPPPASTSSTSSPLLPPPSTGASSLSSLVTLPPPSQLQAPQSSSSGLPLLGGNFSVVPPPTQSPMAAGGAANIQSSPQLGAHANIHSMAGGGGGLFSLNAQLPPLTTGLDSQPPPGALTSSVQSDPLLVLNDLVVPLESIQPSNLLPMQIITKNNVAVTFHFAKNCPAASVRVIVISIISTSPAPVTSFQFQAAVPKVMRVKLQPPTGTELGAYNPILPPQSISQVMLLANPSQAKIRLKYRVSFFQGGQEVVEMGEAADFPIGF